VTRSWLKIFLSLGVFLYLILFAQNYTHYASALMLNGIWRGKMSNEPREPRTGVFITGAIVAAFLLFLMWRLGVLG